MAIVEGNPITEGDLEYSLTVTHRREDLSSAGGLKLSEFVEKLVDDRLIIDEARRSGMDQYPEIKQAVEQFILRESVVRLYNDEILSKVSVTDNEIEEFYRKNYARISLGIIEVTSEETAEEIVKLLERGKDFEEIASTYSIHISREKGGKIVYKRNAIPTYFMDIISKLQPGEISDTINVLNRYYIVKYYGKEEAPWGEEFEKTKRRIEEAIRKQKEKERSDEYLNYLHQKFSININEELLDSIKLDAGIEERKELEEDMNPLVVINSTTLTVGDFVSMARPSTRRTKDEILKSWIDFKLVDLEALSRHYEREPDLKRMVYRYENQLLKDMYIKRVVVPDIRVTDEMAEEFYKTNQELFMSPARYNLQQITLRDFEEAEVVLKNLQKGADFSWWAERKSIDSVASKGGNAGWFVKSELPGPVAEIIDNLEPGDISSILEINSNYMIIRLKEKIDEKVKPYEKVKNTVQRAVFSEQIKEILNEYVTRLKEDAEVIYYDQEIESLEDELFK